MDEAALGAASCRLVFASIFFTALCAFSHFAAFALACGAALPAGASEASRCEGDGRRSDKTGGHQTQDQGS